MKNKFITVITSFALLIGMASVALPASSVGAIDVFKGACPQGGTTNGSSSSVCGATQSDDLPSMIKTVINILLFLIGIIAVVAIIIGGIRYTTSNGDSGAIKSAKDTILYAVIGLIVAIMSYAIVNFVVGAF